MNDNHLTKASLVCILCSLLFLASCCINIGNWSMKAKYERTVNLSAPMSAGSDFKAKTHNGHITINGMDITECTLVANIVARAATDEEAQNLAEETTVELESIGRGINVKIVKPQRLRNRSVSVSLDVKIPKQADLELVTHNGPVRITDIEGEINAVTHNGKVTAETVTGTTQLRTHNGAVLCSDISGNTELNSHNGSVKAYYAESAPSVCDISMTTHNGGIELATPPDFSASVEASTHNGSIRTDLPIMVIGKVSKSKLTGKIGTGEGKLHLETHNGSISIK